MVAALFGIYLRWSLLVFLNDLSLLLPRYILSDSKLSLLSASFGPSWNLIFPIPPMSGRHSISDTTSGVPI